MEETLQQTIKRLCFCRDCIDRSYEAGRSEYERLDGMIKDLRIKEKVRNKKEQVISTIEQALKTYNRHRKFTVSVSDKVFSDFTVLVYPASQKMSGGYLPAAFHSGLLFRYTWNECPDKEIDWVDKYL